MREDATQHGTNQQQRRRSGAAIPLGIVKRKEILVREQVAVYAGQDNAGQGIVLERATRHGLAAALECDERKWRKDCPANVILIGRWRREGDDECGRDDEQGLRGKGHYQHPSPLGRKVPVEAGEQEGSNAEAHERNARLVEARICGGIKQRCEAQADIDRVS